MDVPSRWLGQCIDEESSFRRSSLLREDHLPAYDPLSKLLNRARQHFNEDGHWLDAY